MPKLQPEKGVSRHVPPATSALQRDADPVQQGKRHGGARGPWAREPRLSEARSTVPYGVWQRRFATARGPRSGAPHSPKSKPDFRGAGCGSAPPDESEPAPGTARKKEDGGAEGTRTPDPHNAIVVLYQLSYDPTRLKHNLGTSPRLSKSLWKAQNPAEPPN
jgi:hypothetical protein